MMLHLDMSIPEDPVAALSAIKKIAWKIELTQHCQSAGLVILIYDYFLTLSDEIRYIWPSKWSWVKIVFLMNRYISPLVIINGLIMVSAFTFDVPTCQRELFAVSISNIFSFATWNVLLTLRVHALWGARRCIGIPLGIAFACSTTASVIVTTLHDLNIARTVVVIKDLKVCAPGAPLPRSYFAVWLPSLLFETIVFLMTMYKVIGQAREEVHSVTSLILRDGVIYFVTIFGARVANMILYISRDPGIVYTVLFLLTGLGSTMVSRMTLNLRTWRTEGTEGTTVTPRQRLSHFPPAVSSRVLIPALGTGIRPSAGRNGGYFNSRGVGDAFGSKDDFLVLDSKNDIPLKTIHLKV